ncbi:hypothetical protein [Flavobacterium sp.]|uniref:hypothetical protein n=1 Tax=Flavobacterium sp. TaxID=239 RepID=UPI003D6C3C39
MSSFIQNMVTTLSDRILKLERINDDNDYSGGSWYDEVVHSMYLYSDMTFMYKIESFKSVSGSELSLPQQNDDKYLGVWQITYEDFKMYLTFIFEDNTQQKYETENLGAGLQRLGDQIWNRYRIT